MNLTDKIKAVREQKRFTQAEVSRRLEMEPPAYHRLENRGDKLSINQLQRISEALEVDVDYILNYGSTDDAIPDAYQQGSGDLQREMEIEAKKLLGLDVDSVKPIRYTSIEQNRVFGSSLEEPRESMAMISLESGSRVELAERLNKYQEEKINTLKFIINQIVINIEKEVAIRVIGPSIPSNESGVHFTKLNNEQIELIRNKIIETYPAILLAINMGLMSDGSDDGKIRMK